MLDLHAYLNRLASAQPAPGGGSAATLVGAFGAALVAMVARITLGNPQHAAVHADAALLVATADTLRAKLTAARAVDEDAYTEVVAAQALPRDTPEAKAARTARLQSALGGAAEAPLLVAALTADLLDACAAAAALHNSHLMSDVECAVAFARAALEASAANVRVNHRYMKDATAVGAQTRRLDVILDAASASERRARTTIAGPSASSAGA